MTHVVWDWNGTLVDDLPVVVEAVNESLARFGLGPIDAGGYRTHYTRPVVGFYEALFGRPLAEEEWREIDDAFHDAYRSGLDEVSLAADAREALDGVAAAGWSQSLLSMWWHDELVPFAARLGVDGYMVRVDGNRGDAGETKVHHLAEHLATLADGHGLDPGPGAVLVVGDALDDAMAASTVGVRCVLYDSGSHHRSELDRAGVPVADTLVHALELGGVL